ncbi:MAG: SH3 domain-containing protein [Pseudomonadota bacterium]
MRKSIILAGALCAIAATFVMSGAAREQASETPVTTSFADPPRLSPAPDSEPILRSMPIYVSGSKMRLRAGPGTSYRRLHAFDRGARLAFGGERRGKWMRVTDAGSGLDGWMHGNFLSEQRPASMRRDKLRSAANAQRTDSELRRALIRRSIAAYPGPCACPYHVDRIGNRCGRRSAHTRVGGHEPLCFERDVTDAMLSRLH